MFRLTPRVLLSLAAVLPMLAPLVWEPGWPRLALESGVALASISPMEQPLTVRTLAGAWLTLVLVGWFALAYLGRRQQRLDAWEVALVLVGAAVALPRLGNVWLTALLLAPSLARRTGVLKRPWLMASLSAALVVVSGASLLISRPATLPEPAVQAVLADPGQGAIFSYWRWSTVLQRDVADRRPVLGAGDLHNISEGEWTDYQRVSLAHARWADVLRADDADLVVLDASTQTLAADLVRRSAEWQVLFDANGALVARRVVA